MQGGAPEGALLCRALPLRHLAAQRKSPSTQGVRAGAGPSARSVRRPFSRDREPVPLGPGVGVTPSSAGSPGRRPGSHRVDPPESPHPSHCPPAPPAQTTLPEVRGGRGAGLARAGEGPARAAALSQCGAPQGGHVSLFGAFVRAQVCWCSECGQAARTEQVGVGLAETTAAADGGLREGRDGREGSGGAVAAAPCGERQAGPRVPEGLAGGGRFALCVARAEPRLCPRSLGARLSLGKGRGQLG